MLKICALIKKKDGMSRKEFIDYYENNHVPLLKRLFPYLEHYTRKYVDFDDPFTHVVYGDGTKKDVPSKLISFDAIAESTFSSRELFERFISALTDPTTAKIVHEDEEKFTERRFASILVVEEFSSE